MCACLPARLDAWLFAAALTVSVPIFQLLYYLPECPRQYEGEREREREREKTMRGRGGACSDCRVAKEMEREGERDREKDGQNEAGVPLTASCGLAAWLFAWPCACMFACLPSCPTRCRHVCLISCLTLHSETREWGDRPKRERERERERERHSIRIWPLGWVAGDLSRKLARGVAELLGGEMAG